MRTSYSRRKMRRASALSPASAGSACTLTHLTLLALRVMVTLDADGSSLQDILALPDSWIVTSGHQNLIAFKVQAEHLKSALKAANSSAADFVEIRLTTHRKAGAEGRPKPYLCLTSKGMSTNMTHDMPIGKVFSPEGWILKAFSTSLIDCLHRLSSVHPYYPYMRIADFNWSTRREVPCKCISQP